jgi:DNA-directed RNA polymerase beta subunit/DNA-directed RNA polymerase beta' subunit
MLDVPIDLDYQLDYIHRLQITKYTYEDIEATPEQCIASKITYASQLLCTLSLTNTSTGKTVSSPRKLLANIPEQTRYGDFVWAPHAGAGIKANRYVLIMQLTKAPGIYYYIRKTRQFRIRYCIVRSEFGRGILFREVTTLSSGDIAKSIQLSGDKDQKYDDLEDLWEKVGNEFTVARSGKRQMFWATTNAIKSLEVDNPSLTFNELVEIEKLFANNSLGITDDRSLATRRVLRYQDFLPRLIKKGIEHLKKEIAERWMWIPENERDSGLIINRLIGYCPLQQIIDSFFSDNNLFQLLDTTNPLAEISMKRRVTLRGPGGYPEKSLLLEKRDVHPTDFGRLCPIETPQGQDLGFSLYLAKDAIIDGMGFLCAKYINRENNQVEWLNVYDEITRDIVVGDGLSKEAKLVQARTASGDELIEKEHSSLTHQMPSPHTHLGYAASLIPFLRHNDANRALMGANMMKQALPLLHKQVPLVVTGLERDIAKMSRTGSPFIVNDQVLLGINLLTGYLPWDYYTYEDAVVISESLVRQDKLTHVETEEIFFDAVTNRYQKEVITSDSEYLDTDLRVKMGLGSVPLSGLHNLIMDPDNEFDGVIRSGAQFKPGDILVSRLRFVDSGAVERDDQAAAELLKILWRSSTNEKDTLNEARISNNFDHTEDASLYAAQGVFGEVVNVEWVGGVKERRRLKIVFVSQHPVRVGDKLTGRHGNKGIISRIIPERDMPYFHSEGRCCSDIECSITEDHTHLELLINPLTITSRMNLGQLYETSSSWLAEFQPNGLLCVPPFSPDWSWQKIREALDEKSIPVKRKLFYRENGEEVPIGGDDEQKTVTVGYQYILKLKHLAEKKNKTRSQSVLNPATGQPITPVVSNKNEIAAIWENRTARKNSAQRLGEMEVWALQGHGAWHLLDELLFLKSDSNHLKRQMIDAIHESNRARRIAFSRFEKTAVRYKWNAQSQGDHLIVTCAEQKENLADEAIQCGLKIEDLPDGRFKLTHVPLEVFHRAHQAFKTFALYCRGLGFEVEGEDIQGKTITLLDCQANHWPRLTAVNIRIAGDKERRGWARREIKSSRGNDTHGLWPDAWDEPKKWDEDTAVTHNEGCDHIKLPIPIDNPLFRPHLRTLLSVEGCRVDGQFMVAFQNLLTRNIASFSTYSQDEWKDFWKASLSNRSRLLMKEDVISWLKEYTPADTTKETVNTWLQESGINFSYDFRSVLPSRFTTSNRYAVFPATVEEIGEFTSKSKGNSAGSQSARFHVRDLYRHFELMDLDVLAKRLESFSDKKQKKALGNLIIIMDKSGYRPTDFFLSHLTVLPRNLRHEHQSPRKPSLRSSISNYIFNNDLNYIYQHILVAMDRRQGAKDSIQIQADIEERQLRPLVHALLSNRPEIMTPVRRTGGRQLHGIIDTLAGVDTSKDGFFRRYLLGKRLDYSGRAVIIPDPELSIDEASIPFGMGLIIFRDFLIQRCMQEHKINPTTEAILDENGQDTGRTRNIPNAVRVATAKAFVGDKNNLNQLKEWLQEVANIHPILLNRAPSLHRLSLLSFLVRFHDDTPGDPQNDDCIHLNPYVCSPFNADFDGDTMAVHAPFLASAIDDAKRMLPSKILRSAGTGKLCIDHKKDHAIASYYLDAGSANKLYELFDKTARKGHEELRAVTAKQLGKSREQLKQCGLSLGIDDFIIDQAGTRNLVEEARAKSPSNNEEAADYWRDIAENIGKNIGNALADGSPLKVLDNAGAGKVDLQQLSAIRGIMKRPGGTLVHWPILSSIVAGMTPLEYFVSCHGSRNGLADKGLLTAPAGDITNTMVQAAQGITIVAEDCETENGLQFEVPIASKAGVKDFSGFVGRFAAGTIKLIDGNVIKPGDEITKEKAEKIDNLQGAILLRSPVTCCAINKETRLKGLCQKCYGRELAGGKLPEIGYPAGIIAAQSIGEPGTQLTLSSFHAGGVGASDKKFGIMDVRLQFIEIDSSVRGKFKSEKPETYADAAEKQLALLQERYFGLGIADQHFEVIISTMFITTKQIPNIENKPIQPELVTKQIRSVLQAAINGDGFLSRLAFKDVSQQLVRAALEKEHDQLSDSKSRTMIGQVI